MRVNDELLNNIKKKDFFLYNHFDDFLYMHNSFKHCVSKISKPICNSETRINDDESIAISKKIIEYINPNYISTFNYIIDNKNIVFDSNSNGSRFTATDWSDKKTWKIIIEEEKKYKIEFRTKKELFSEIEYEIKKVHDYYVAEISSYKIENASKEFLDWIEETTK